MSLTRLVGRLRDQKPLPGLKRSASSQRLSASRYGHLPLLEVIEAGASKRAVSILERHLDRTLADWSRQDRILASCSNTARPAPNEAGRDTSADRPDFWYCTPPAPVCIHRTYRKGGIQRWIQSEQRRSTGGDVRVILQSRLIVSKVVATYSANPDSTESPRDQPWEDCSFVNRQTFLWGG